MQTIWVLGDQVSLENTALAAADPAGCRFDPAQKSGLDSAKAFLAEHVPT